MLNDYRTTCFIRRPHEVSRNERPLKTIAQRLKAADEYHIVIWRSYEANCLVNPIGNENGVELTYRLHLTKGAHGTRQ